MFFKYFKRILILVIIYFIIANINVSAANLKDAFKSQDTNAGPSVLDKTALGSGFNTIVTADNIIGIIIQTALSLLGVIFLGIMIFGGYLWMTGRGNEERVTRAKNLIWAAIIGLIIVVSAYAISYFIISKASTNVLQTN